MAHHAPYRSPNRRRETVRQQGWLRMSSTFACKECRPRCAANEFLNCGVSMRVLTALVCLIAGTATSSASDWETLFNGHDLTGWRANNDQDSFSVKDGALRQQASGATSSHLFYVGDKGDGLAAFKDFELEAVCACGASLEWGESSCTRTCRLATTRSTSPEATRCNSIVRPRRLEKQAACTRSRTSKSRQVDETKWFTVRVVVRGKRITVASTGRKSSITPSRSAWCDPRSEPDESSQQMAEPSRCRLTTRGACGTSKRFE